MKGLTKTVLRILPFALIAALVASIVLSGKELTVATVLSYMPENLLLAAVVFMGLYALKSLSILFPILVLHVAGGIIFPRWQALFLNTIGTAVAYSIPYILGRISGAPAAERLMQKYPKVRDIVDSQRSSDWFPSFFLRAVSCLPADVISMYLGSIRVPYIPYVIASVLGTMPGLIPATIAGTSLANPKSPAFIISVTATIVSSLGSVLVYKLLKSKNNGRKKGD